MINYCGSAEEEVDVLREKIDNAGFELAEGEGGDMPIGLLFIAVATFVFAMFYRGRTYLRSQEPTPDEIATEHLLAGGTDSS